MSKGACHNVEADAEAAFRACLDFPSLLKGGRVAARWMGGGRFWFVEGAPENTCIKVVDATTGSCEALFDVQRVRKVLQAVIGREPPYRGLPFDSFSRTPDGGAAFRFEGEDYVLSPSGEQVARSLKPSFIELAAGTDLKARTSPRTFIQSSYFHAMNAAPEMLSPDGQWFAGIQDHNLYLRSTADGRLQQITQDGESGCSWDIETPRIGMGANWSVATRVADPWSSDGLRLFVTQFDKRGTGLITRTRMLKRVDEVEQLHWVRSGDKLPEILPYVMYTMDRRLTRLEIDTKDCMLLFLGWAKDGKELYFVQFSRDMKRGTVFAADPGTGETRALFSEQGTTFIRLQHDLFGGRSGCTLLPAGLGFLWESERDGWRHLYHYDMKGSLVRRVTEGAWPVVDFQGIDERTGMVYFSAHHDQRRPYDIHLCRVPLSGGPIERLTEGEGVHEVQMAPDFSGFIDTLSRPDEPPRSVVCNAAGKVVYRFEPMDTSALESIGWTHPEEFCVKAADGATDLWGVIYKPRNFDPGRSYPVIEHIYGGPQISWASHAFPTSGTGIWALAQALPQWGYVSIVLDARGTPERSKSFQDAVFKDWRRHVTADHAAALRGLAKERPWMDLRRVGIWGHSWGGYFTFACMIDEPDLYRAGVSSAPSYDPYDGFIYEPYLDGIPRAENRGAYEDALLYREAPRLKGKLQIIAGSDDVSVWHSGVKMSNALIEAGKDHDFVMLPEQHHAFAPLHERYAIDKMIRHFDRYVRDTGED
jgi:dipeptidyl aminopeptidase/acylaminoacyl peptidase